MTETPAFEYLVVIGSSAGGIEALSTLVATLPEGFPAPIVVAQHLDPRRTSHLGEILARRGTLPVRTVTDEEPLVPGVVYVVPADQHVEVNDHAVRLRGNGSVVKEHPKPSIDRLLNTAARVFGERLIAVVLTGTGSDGTSGAHAVKAAGGMVVIQNPATAAYPGMPASLAPTTVDLVADVERIGPLLFELMTKPQEITQPETTTNLQTVLEQVRQHSGVDFSRYKPATILRRLQRRMAATGTGQLSEYLRYLTAHSEEYSRLIASFLINVTEFFRDAEFFAALREQVLPELIAHAHAEGAALRIWSAGCATGEEAYSVAILVAEALDKRNFLEQVPVQIFATDLDAEAVDFARRGIYSAAALGGIADDLRDRHFTRLDGTYEVSKRLRGMIVFGQHDLGQRAPFPHMDLVLCRNVLIYFTPELQERALRLFAFALRDGGYLALGKAEGVHPLAEYLMPVNDHLKIYRRHGERILGPITRIRTGAARAMPDARANTPIRSEARLVRHPPTEITVPPTRTRSVSERLGDVMLDATVGVVVVDRHYDVQVINKQALRLLGIYKDAIGNDLVHLAEGIPAKELRAAIDAAFQGSEPDTGGASVTVETTQGERRHLYIACYPRETPKAATEPPLPRAAPVSSVLVLISDVTSDVRARQDAERRAAREQAEREQRQSAAHGDAEDAYRALMEEHQRTMVELARATGINESLLDANQEYAATTLELRSANEELLIGHEEAEATAEEVKTLNEELQATNEELVTLNEEMEATVEELHAANEDIQARNDELRLMAESLEAQRAASEAARARAEAILLSMGDAVLVVDPTGTPLLTNTAYVEMFGGAQTTLGAPFVALDETGHPLPAQATPQRRAARGEDFTMEFILIGEDGARRYFEADGKPIQSEGKALGGVVTIRDITDRSLHRLEEEFISLASHELRTPLTPLTSYLQLLATLFADQPEESRPRYLVERAQIQVRRLTRLVGDLMDVRRLRTGKFTMETRPVELDELVERAVEMAQTIAPASQKIRLERPDPSAPPAVVNGDAGRLEQALMNLLTNAIIYAPNTDHIDVRLARSGTEARVRVRDYGHGISETELSHLTERFYQVTRTDSDRPSRRGLGLGLFLVNEIVAAHGGRLEMSSVEGRGATFTIHLPLADPRVGPPAGERRAPKER